jgi:hypothetical protein
MEYKIISSKNLYELENVVGEYISFGYEPLGGVQVEHYDNEIHSSRTSGSLMRLKPNNRFIQTMIKKEVNLTRIKINE